MNVDFKSTGVSRTFGNDNDNTRCTAAGPSSGIAPFTEKIPNEATNDASNKPASSPRIDAGKRPAIAAAFC